MPSTSKPKSYRQKSKFVPKPKQIWRVKQPTRNWLELPSDLMVNILQRISVIEILDNAQKVCTAWRAICMDPAMWRLIYMENNLGSSGITVYRKMCKQAVDRSQGQLAELTMVGFCDYELLQFVADRARQLKRLEIVHYFGGMYGICCQALKKLSLLEELSLFRTNISVEHIVAAGRCCPLLKTLKVNQSEAFKTYSSWKVEDDDADAEDDDVGNAAEDDDEESMIVENEIALAIGKNLPGLTHLELIGNCMENIGLQAILDGCCHLESLDLRRCLFVDLEGDLGKRCLQQIKHLKLPHESLEGYPHAYDAYDALDDSEDDWREYYEDPEYHGYFDSEGEYHGYFDDEYAHYGYDGHIAYDNDDFAADFESLSEMMAFMAMFG
ncbi:hypothetical protein R6Q59_034978 [Mikania micrantha]